MFIKGIRVEPFNSSIKITISPLNSQIEHSLPAEWSSQPPSNSFDPTCKRWILASVRFGLLLCRLDYLWGIVDIYISIVRSEEAVNISIISWFLTNPSASLIGDFLTNFRAFFIKPYSSLDNSIVNFLILWSETQIDRKVHLISFYSSSSFKFLDLLFRSKDWGHRSNSRSS